MRKLFLALLPILVTACTHVAREPQNPMYSSSRFNVDYSTRVPATYPTKGKKLVLVDPNTHAWGAYSESGDLIRAGIASSGGRTCPPDADEADCRTSVGHYKIYSVGGEECYSKSYPRPNGGGLMPWCMYFHKGMALHGSPDSIVVDGNISHGCVRMRIADAEWMVKHFAKVGTDVVVRPYN